MQRCFFLLAFITVGWAAPAQPVDVISTELSFYARAPEKEGIQCKALLTLKLADTVELLVLDFRPDTVYRIRLRQGRLKDHLPYTLEDQKLKINLKGWRNRPQEVALEVQYRIDSRQPALRPYFQKTPDLLAMNAFNAYTEKGLSLSGLFFPARTGDACFYRINVSLPENFDLYTLGEPEFTVTEATLGAVSYFWGSAQAYPPEAFYLISGSFNGESLRQLNKTYRFTEVDLGAVKAIALRQEMEAVLRFAKTTTGYTASDSVLAILDSLRKEYKPDLLRADRATTPGQGEAQQREEILLFLAAQRDTLKAYYLSFLYAAQAHPPRWKYFTLRELWPDTVKGPVVDRYQLYLRTMEWLQNQDSSYRNRVFQDTSRVPPSSSEVSVALARKVIHLGQPPRLSVDYRYREGRQHLIFTQDTAATMYSVPGKVTVFLKDTSLTRTFLTRPVYRDTVTLPVAVSPQAVQVDFGRFFPGFVSDHRPDVYDLYALSHAENEAGQTEALTRLLESTNANLFSTALGIAMDDVNVEIRLMALKKATTLSLPAQRKLEDTLRQLATGDPDERVRKRAGYLVGKYYP